LGRDRVDVVAFSSRTAATARAAAGQWGSGEVVDDWRKVLERDDVDAVDICSPNALHAEMAVAAARAGKHVLVEKPMATTLADADAMIEAAEANDVVLMPAHNLRFAPPYAAAALAVRGHTIGEVVAVRAAFGHAGPERWAPGATWFRDPALAGGGALVDLGVHVADLVRAVTGDDIDEVSAFVHRPSEGEVDDAAQVAFRLRRTHALGTFSASWRANPGPDHHLTVHGTEGTLTVERGQAVVRSTTADKLVLDPPPDLVDPYAAFVAACATGEPPPVTGADGRAALAVVLAAYEAASTRRTVSVLGSPV
jgi:predicted dehydrogenase